MRTVDEVRSDVMLACDDLDAKSAAHLLQDLAEEMLATVETEVVDLDLEDDVIVRLSLVAHERRVTLNRFLIEVIEKALEGVGDDNG